MIKQYLPIKTSFLFIGLLILTTQAVAGWEMLEIEGALTARHEGGFVAHNKELYLIGGRGMKPIEVYNPATNNWHKKGTTPIEMHHFTPVSVGDKILVVTGLTGPYPTEQPFSHVWEFDPKTEEWRKTYEIPEERRRGGAGVTTYDGKIYIVGGIKFGHTSGTTNMADVYDPKEQTWTILTDAPHIRDHSNAAVIDGKLLAFGGRNGSYHEEDIFFAFIGQVNDKVDVYDIDKGRWTTFKERLPVPTAGASSVVYKGRLYYTGGEHAPKPASDRTVSFDLKTKSWREEPKLTQGRHGTNGALIGNKMYVAAGSANQGGGPELNSIEVYEFKE